MGPGRRALLHGLALGWGVFWFWAFSFAFSDSYFRYDTCSRVPLFAAAYLGAWIVPLGGYRVWRMGVGALATCALQALVALMALGVLAVTSFVLSRAPRPCRLTGDDAMGAGIDFMVLAGVAAVSILVLGAARVVSNRSTPSNRDQR